MKIIYKSYAGGGNRELSVVEAVQDAATPSAYSYEGQLEKLAQQNEKLRDMLANLVECLYGESKDRLNKVQAVEYILGYGYEVEE